MKGNLKELIRKRFYKQFKKELRLPSYTELWPINSKRKKGKTWKL